MKKLKMINAKIARKQVGRIVIGTGQVILGLILIGKFMYQRGITDCQNAICEEFPDEYSAMTEKVVKAFENE